MAALTFGNVHGVYAPGNVKLRPSLLKEIQDGLAAKYGTGPKPLDLVFHGGSGSTDAEIAEAVANGVVKMNIDTDTQYAFTRSIAGYMFSNYDGVLKVDGERRQQEAVRPACVGQGRRVGHGRARRRVHRQLGSAGQVDHGLGERMSDHEAARRQGDTGGGCRRLAASRPTSGLVRSTASTRPRAGRGSRPRASDPPTRRRRCTPPAPRRPRGERMPRRTRRAPAARAPRLHPASPGSGAPGAPGRPDDHDRPARARRARRLEHARSRCSRCRQQIQQAYSMMGVERLHAAPWLPDRPRPSA